MVTDIASGEIIYYRLLNLRVNHHVFVARISDDDMNAILEMLSYFVCLKWRPAAVQCATEE